MLCKFIGFYSCHLTNSAAKWIVLSFGSSSTNLLIVWQLCYESVPSSPSRNSPTIHGALRTVSVQPFHELSSQCDIETSTTLPLPSNCNHNKSDLIRVNNWGNPDTCCCGMNRFLPRLVLKSDAFVVILRAETDSAPLLFYNRRAPVLQWRSDHVLVRKAFYSLFLQLSGFLQISQVRTVCQASCYRVFLNLFAQGFFFNFSTHCI